MRERSPGVWEIRVAVGVDPVSGRTVQRSFAFHGGAEDAELHRKELAAEWAERRAIRRAAPFLSVADLLERWLCARHDWRPATWIGARSNVKTLRTDPLAVRRVSTLKPEHVRAAMAAWSSAGASVAVVSGRFRVLRSAVGWAHVERIIDVNPLSGVRGPQRPGTRLHLATNEVLRLLEAAEVLVSSAESRDAKYRHKAEQIRLLVRLPADSGARRGELVALCFDDLDGRVLSIERGVSADVLGPTKTGRTRRLTLGRQTVELWGSSAECWVGRLPRGRWAGTVALLPVGRSPGAVDRGRTRPLVRPTRPADRGRGGIAASPAPQCVWRRFSSGEASCSGLSSDSVTGTLRQRCGTTPMPCHPKTRPWPTTSTSCSVPRYPNHDHKPARIPCTRSLRRVVVVSWWVTADQPCPDRWLRAGTARAAGVISVSAAGEARRRSNWVIASRRSATSKTRLRRPVVPCRSTPRSCK